jgi:hypothetical protein
MVFLAVVTENEPICWFQQIQINDLMSKAYDISFYTDEHRNIFVLCSFITGISNLISGHIENIALNVSYAAFGPILLRVEYQENFIILPIPKKMSEAICSIH